MFQGTLNIKVELQNEGSVVLSRTDAVVVLLLVISVTVSVLCVNHVLTVHIPCPLLFLCV